MAKQAYNLVADIGGTNARFALVEPGSNTPVAVKAMPCSEFLTAYDAMQAYLDEVKPASLGEVSLAVAGPVTAAQFSMTNHRWDFDLATLRHSLGVRLGVRRVKALNDFTALALAVPKLSAEHYHQVGGGEANPDKTKGVIGPGTGLGVSGLVPCQQGWYPIVGEGGHVAYGPLTKREIAVIEIIGAPLSAESLVSGSGLAALYQAITELESGVTDILAPSEISQQAIDGLNANAEEALALFCGILGSVAGNLALSLGARGGVYVGGGIVPRILDYFTDSDFRDRFEGYGKGSAYLVTIPTYVIIDRYPALRGAALALDDSYQTVGYAVS